MSKEHAQELYKKNIELVSEMYGYVNKQVAIELTRSDLFRERNREAAHKGSFASEKHSIR